MIKIVETSEAGSYNSALKRIADKVRNQLSRKSVLGIEVKIVKDAVDIIDKKTNKVLYQIYPEKTGERANTTGSTYKRVFDPKDIDWDKDIVYKSVDVDKKIDTYSSKKVRIKEVSSVSNDLKKVLLNIVDKTNT